MLLAGLEPATTVDMRYGCIPLYRQRIVIEVASGNTPNSTAELQKHKVRVEGFEPPKSPDPKSGVFSQTRPHPDKMPVNRRNVNPATLFFVSAAHPGHRSPTPTLGKSLCAFRLGDVQFCPRHSVSLVLHLRLERSTCGL